VRYSLLRRSQISRTPQPKPRRAASIGRERREVERFESLLAELSAAMARAYAERLAAVISPIPVELVDERLTTVTAERTLAARGIRGRARRAVVDQAAAVEILQHWLDARPARSAPDPTDERA